MAGWVHLPTLRSSEGICNRFAAVVAMRGLPTPDLSHGRDDPSPNQDVPDRVFWAAYLMTTDKRGLSALLLQRQLGLSSYETVWMMLHKLRRAMVNATREPLHGEVEVDDTWVGGEQAGLRGSRQLKNRRAALVLVAVEKRGPATGRARMNVIPDFQASTIIP